MTEDFPALRLVIVNYNGGDKIISGLRAIAASGWPAGKLDLVVVDNGSRDGSLERIESELVDVRVKRSPSNLGYPAINQVIEDLDGVDLVAVINPDAIVEPGCLQALCAALLADPSLGAACPRILLDGCYHEVHFGVDGAERNRLDLLEVDSSGQTSQWHLSGASVRRRWKRGVAWSIGDGSVLRTSSPAGTVLKLRLLAHRPTRVVVRSGDEEIRVALERSPVDVAIEVGGISHAIVQNAGSQIGPHGLGINRGFHQVDGPDFDKAVDVPAWCGAAVMLRSEYLRDVGEFDPRWFLYYEDLDLSWRGLTRGWRYRYVPAAIVRHSHSSTIGHGSATYVFHHERNRVLTVTKSAPGREVISTWVDAIRLIWRQIRSDVLGRLRDRRLPEPVLTARRVWALASAIRLTPAVLRDRRRVRARRTKDDHLLPILGRHDSAFNVQEHT